MEFVKVEKTVYARDRYGIKYQVFAEGQVVDKAVYDAAVSAEPEVKKTSASVPVVVENLEPLAEPKVVENPEAEVEADAEVKPEVVKAAEETADTKPAKVKQKAKEGK